MDKERFRTRAALSALIVMANVGCGFDAHPFAASSDALASQSGSPKAYRERSSEAEMDAPDALEGRKLIYTANLTLRATDLAEAGMRAREAVRAAGGYVQRQNDTETGLWLTVRVPVSALEGLMDTLAGTGRTVTRGIAAEDVSERYFDLEGRLKNKRILEERYREYLKKATTVKDILEVEARLSETTTELESLEGAFRDLGKRIDLATLEVTIWPVQMPERGEPTVGESLGRLFASAGDVFGSALVFVVGLVLYGIPALLALAAFWFLAFGRLGLVRRLFARVGRRSRLTEQTHQGR